MSASAIQEKVARLLSRQNGKPAIKPVKPLVLKDEVANRKPKKGEATCLTEMSVMMACWKQNDFSNEFCSHEVTSFFTCVEKAKSKDKGKHGGRLLSEEVNTLLKRFPNQRSQI